MPICHKLAMLLFLGGAIFHSSLAAQEEVRHGPYRGIYALRNANVVEVDCPKGENICRIVDKAKAAVTAGGGIWIATTSSKFVELHKQAAEGKLTVEHVREYIARSSLRVLPEKMNEKAAEAALKALRSKQFRRSAQGTGIFGVVVAGGIIANEVITGIVQDKLHAEIKRGYTPEMLMPPQK